MDERMTHHTPLTPSSLKVAKCIRHLTSKEEWEIREIRTLGYEEVSEVR